jgi:hypothetical protein
MRKNWTADDTVSLHLYEKQPTAGHIRTLKEKAAGS